MRAVQRPGSKTGVRVQFQKVQPDPHFRVAHRADAVVRVVDLTEPNVLSSRKICKVVFKTLRYTVAYYLPALKLGRWREVFDFFRWPYYFCCRPIIMTQQGVQPTMTVSQKKFVTADVNNDDYKNIHSLSLNVGSEWASAPCSRVVSDSWSKHGSKTGVRAHFCLHSL